MTNEQQQQQLNERVERDLRTMIGDLHVQIVVLRAQLDQAKSAQDIMATAMQAVKINGDARPETRL